MSEYETKLYNDVLAIISKHVQDVMNAKRDEIVQYVESAVMQKIQQELAKNAASFNSLVSVIDTKTQALKESYREDIKNAYASFAQAVNVAIQEVESRVDKLEAVVTSDSTEMQELKDKIDALSKQLEEVKALLQEVVE